MAPVPSAVAPTTEARVVSSSEALQHYAVSHSPTDLQKAVVAMDGGFDIGTLTPANFMGTRRELVRGWSQVISAIERSSDPSFNPQDPNQRPTMCVLPPPPIPSGATCNDPQSVSDPKVRAAFVSAIQENNEKIQRSADDLRLGRLEVRVLSSLDVTPALLRKVAPEGASSDSAALDAIVEQAGVRASTRAMIDTYFFAKSVALTLHSARA